MNNLSSEEVAGMFPKNKSTIDISSHAGRQGTSTFAGNKQVERIQRGDSGSAARFFYTAKASKGERNKGLENFPLRKSELNSGGIGREISVEKRLEAGEENAPLMKNHHPTVKPISLMRYLCRLITPPKGVILDPFMGSGSTGIAAKLEGFNFIGIEKEEEYMKIAEARINAWEPEPKQSTLL